ncbi:hypothetical protein U9M48_020655 [Paspalum notatum var. saurae]|uniref:Cathepsin propeptide inhibitor domain-containing protein n=1 Tax=Paspalum notatum var. saurae TaxID=547442 RepID=A0AAQ3WSV4_PASNO
MASAAAARSAAARHLTRPSSPLAPPGPRILRCGLATIPGDHRPGSEQVSPDCIDPEAAKHFSLICFDPEAPDDPATCFIYDEKDLESDETMWALYERWRSFYEVKRDHDDMVRRFRYFKDAARSIHEFNKSGKPYTWGLQIFDDQTPEEKAARYKPRFSRR